MKVYGGIMFETKDYIEGYKLFRALISLAQ